MFSEPIIAIAVFLLIIVAVVSAVLAWGGRKALWPLFHLLGVLLALPSFLFASACLVMQRATRGSLLDFIDSIGSFILAMYPWGTVVVGVCLLILLAAGFGTRWRRAAAVVAVVVLGSAAVIHWVAGLPEGADHWWFFVPGALSVLVSGVLFVTARTVPREFGFQYPQGPSIGRDTVAETLRPLEGRPGFSRRQIGAAGWVWYALPPFQDGAMKIGVELGFQDGTLRQIGLFHDDPAIYGTYRGNGSANKEPLRAESIRAWLSAKGFPAGSYPWGEVWVGYDPRSDFGSAGVRYAPTPRSRVHPSATGVVEAPLHVESSEII